MSVTSWKDSNVYSLESIPSNSSITERIQSNWQRRKVQILLSTGLALILSGALVVSSGASIIGLLALCSIANLGRSLLRTPKPIRLIQVPKFWQWVAVPCIIGVGFTSSSTFRMGALAALVDLFVVLKILSPIIDRICPEIKPKNTTLPYERMTDEGYIQYHEYLWYSRSIEAPIQEELFFRGLLQPFLSSKLGPVIGTIIDSVLFGYAHKKMKQRICAAFGGLICGYLKIRYGLLASMAYHITFNTFIRIAQMKEINTEFEEWCRLKNYRVSYSIFPSFPEILPQRSRDRK